MNTIKILQEFIKYGDYQERGKIQRLIKDKNRDSEYTKQADDFCKKYGVEIKFTYLDSTPNKAWGDKKEDKRDNYCVTVTRGDKKKTFEFHASIMDYWLRLASERAFFKTEEGKIVLPKPYDFLACIQKYEVGSFENFCSDFGYDKDSRKALEMYMAVQKEWSDISYLFSDCLEELQEIN